MRPTVLWPSASTVADAGLSVNVMPFVVIVDDAVKPLYVAVTVAVTVEPLDTDVSVLDVCPDPFVVAEAG